MAVKYDFGTELDVISSMTEGLPTHRSWTKDDFVGESGRKCMFGAVVGDNMDMLAQLSSHPAVEILAGVIEEQYPDRLKEKCRNKTFIISNADKVQYFNDHPNTRFADVRVVLDKSLVKAAEKIL